MGQTGGEKVKNTINSLLPVIDRGPGWLVIEKPAGLSTHNDPDRDLCGLISRYLQSNPNPALAVDFDPSYGVHAVHRLDKETSGVILLACRRDVFQHFSRQFAAGHVRKSYLALVHGSVPQSDPAGLWQWPLSAGAAGRRNIQGKGGRKSSLTRYRSEQSSVHYTLLDCQPVTGRIHQIRRHAALAGHPIVGDRRYGSLRACRYVARHHGFERLALHAARLSITLPGSAERQSFESMGLPEEIKRLISADQATGGGKRDVD